MASGTLVMGLFQSAGEAERALMALMSAGIDRGEISAVASDDQSVRDFGIEKHSRVGTGAAIGAGFGGALGAILAGFTAVGALATGGAGLIVAGPLVAALAGAGAGGATGGLLGGLIGLGIPEHEIKYYAENLEKGSVLLGVRTADDNVARIRSIMEEHGATRITTQGIALPAAASGHAAKVADEWAETNPLRRLFIDQLRDIYYAEHQLVDALERLEEGASTPQLAQALHDHREQTREHIYRLDAVFRLIGVRPEQKKCPAINGIIAEAKELLRLDDSHPQRDAAIICAAQKAEHYEIGTYGCLRNYAQTLGMAEAARLLERTLEEEWTADRKLTELAESGINQQASLTSRER